MAKKSRRLTSKPALEGELEMSDLDRVVGGLAVGASQKQIDDHPNAVHEIIAVPAAHVAAPEPPHPTVVQQALAADHTALDAATTALSNAQHDQAGHTGALADANKTLVDARVVLGHENTALANDSKALAGFTQQQGTLDARVDGEHKSLALDQQKLAGGMHDLKSSQSQLTDARSIAAADATAVSHTQSNLTKAQQVEAQDQRAVDADRAAIAHQHGYGHMTAAEQYRLSADQQHWTAQHHVVQGLQSVLSQQSHELTAADQHVADVKHAIAQETSDIAAEQKAVATVEANLAKDVAQQTQLHDTVNRASQQVHQDQVLVNQAEGALSRAQSTVDTLQSQLSSDASAVSAALAACAQLVTGLDLVHRSFLRFRKLHRAGRIAKEPRIFGGLDHNTERGRNGNIDRSRSHVNRAHNATRSALLPVFAIMLLFLGHVSLLHHHNRRGLDVAICASAAAQ